MTIYYDSHENGLIPVRFVGWAECVIFDVTKRYDAIVKISRSKGPWKAGEELRVVPRCIVEKTFRRGAHQYVRGVDLPARTPENTVIRTWK